MAILLECIDFCHFEGKTTYNSFELDLASKLLDSVTTAASKLPLGTKLLIAAYLTKIDNLADESSWPDFSGDNSNIEPQLRSRFRNKLQSIRYDFEHFVELVADQLTQEDVSSLSERFDKSNNLNQRLIKLCVKKGIFADDSQQSPIVNRSLRP